MLGEASDRPALAGGVASLEQDRDPVPGALNPALELDQLDLEQRQLLLVLQDRDDLAEVDLAPPKQLDEPVARGDLRELLMRQRLLLRIASLVENSLTVLLRDDARQDLFGVPRLGP